MSKPCITKVNARHDLPLHESTAKYELTGIGFRLKMMKLSARPVIKRVNLWHKIFSISSACLIAMLTRTELMDGSIMTRSLSFREIVSGVSKTSLDVLSCQVRSTRQ